MPRKGTRNCRSSSISSSLCNHVQVFYTLMYKYHHSFGKLSRLCNNLFGGLITSLTKLTLTTWSCKPLLDSLIKIDGVLVADGKKLEKTNY